MSRSFTHSVLPLFGSRFSSQFWKKAKKSIHAQDESRGEDLSDVDPDKAKGKKGVPVVDGVQVEHGVKYLHPPFGYNWYGQRSALQTLRPPSPSTGSAT